jgi:chromosome segregation ATPase
VQGQLAQSENELSGALDRYKNLERQQMQFDNQIKELKQEINTHRSKVAQLDREKDQLLVSACGYEFVCTLPDSYDLENL